MEFLILGAMSTMVSRPIFDIRADYVERVVNASANSEFSSWTMFLCANLSQNLYEGGWNMFVIFNPWSNVYNCIEADYVEIFGKISAYSEFSR